VHEDLIKNQPEVVKDLVRGIAASGAWAEIHRADAAKLVAPYFRQNRKVLDYVLTSKPERVSYAQLKPTVDDLQKIEDMALSMGLLKKRLVISDLIIESDFVPEIIAPARINLTKIPEPK